MSEPNDAPIHEDVDFFRAAITFTEAKTGFNARLIEKDYFCSLMLHTLSQAMERGLVFKGGTALSKIHCDFYRLSEDLDFAISVPTDASRSERSRAARFFREYLEQRVGQSPAFTLSVPVRGHNNSTQYTSEIEYGSLISDQPERIKLEISVREPILDAPVALPCRALLQDPFRGEPAFPASDATALSLRETYAEKLRAALTRREPAIRDFFDIDFATRRGLIQLDDADLTEMVRLKLAIPGNSETDMSGEKLGRLQEQLQTHLRPVLRERDFVTFNLDVVFDTLRELADGIQA